METTELSTVRSSMIQTVDDLSRIGKMMAISGYFQDAREAAQAAVKVHRRQIAGRSKTSTPSQL